MYRMKYIPSNYMRPMTLSTGLDQTDCAILDALQNNARLSNKELAAKVGLAPSSCLVRFRKLVKANLIRGFYADVDLVALGISLQAIIAVRLVKHSRNRFRSLYAYTHRLPEVLQVFHVSGVNDLLLHVAVTDVGHLRDLVTDGLATRPEVASCETSVIFSQFRQRQLPRFSGPSFTAGPN
jgi:DNA-binding Lrp family transcriptional regulator